MKLIFDEILIRFYKEEDKAKLLIETYESFERINLIMFNITNNIHKLDSLPAIKK